MTREEAIKAIKAWVAVLLLPLITILLKTRKKWKIGSNHSNNVTYENRME